MSQKPTSEGDIIAAIRKRLQEIAPSAMKSLEDLAGQKKNKTVAKKTKRPLHKHKGGK
jgi:ribosomal protein L5